MIDVDSELMNITRKLTNCSSKEFVPKFDARGEIDNTIETKHFNDCNIPTRENTTANKTKTRSNNERSY